MINVINSKSSFREWNEHDVCLFLATSCGLGLKQIQAGSAYCTGSSLVLVTAPPPNSGSRSLFGISGASSKGWKSIRHLFQMMLLPFLSLSLYTALCLSFSYSLSTGSLVTQSELPASAQLHCGLSKGGSIQTLGNIVLAYL